MAQCLVMGLSIASTFLTGYIRRKVINRNKIECIVMPKSSGKSSLISFLEQHNTDKIMFIDIEEYVKNTHKIESSNPLFVVKCKEYLNELKNNVCKKRIVLLVSTVQVAKDLCNKKSINCYIPSNELYQEIKKMVNESQKEPVDRSRNGLLLAINKSKQLKAVNQYSTFKELHQLIINHFKLTNNVF